MSRPKVARAGKRSPRGGDRGRSLQIAVVLSSRDPETAWNAFRFANAAREGEHEVGVFLMGKGVEVTALREKEFDVTAQVQKLRRQGGKVLACGTCLDLRRKGEVAHCTTATMADLLGLVTAADRVVSFG